MLLPFGIEVSMVVVVAASPSRSFRGRSGCSGSSGSDGSPRWARSSSASQTRRNRASRVGLGDSTVIVGQLRRPRMVRCVPSGLVITAAPRKAAFHGIGAPLPERNEAVRRSAWATLRDWPVLSGSWIRPLNHTSPKLIPRSLAANNGSIPPM